VEPMGRKGLAGCFQHLVFALGARHAAATFCL
jgi:hypothetical protein